MKLVSIALFAASISVSTPSFAECPSRLTADDVHECVMMEGSGDIKYKEWAPEFYKKINPEKSASIRAAYEADTKNTEKKGKLTLLD